MTKNNDKKWHQTSRVQYSIAFVFLATILGFCYWYFLAYPYVKSDDARIAANVLRVAPYGVSGRIEKVLVEEGDFVTKGQTLAVLEQETLEAQLERAKARYTLAQKEFIRSQQLYRETSSSQKELDTARANKEIAESELNLNEIALKNSVLKSPVDGVVIQKIALVGNLLEQGQTAIVIADIKNAWVSANVEETKINKVKKEQKVSISIDEGGNLEGKVEDIRIATSAQFALIPNENTSGNYTKLVQRIPVKIKITSNPKNKKLKVGQSVEIKISCLE